MTSRGRVCLGSRGNDYIIQENRFAIQNGQLHDYLKELQMSPNASSFLAAGAEVVELLGGKKRSTLPPLAGCASAGLPHTFCVAKSGFWEVGFSIGTVEYSDQLTAAGAGAAETGLPQMFAPDIADGTDGTPKFPSAFGAGTEAVGV
jgi:hypothetical protein